eukprot:CAMPEP_0206264594 /NCGR_PEP_ID=MMETSP0047_2-20121206/29493_1 /ASSEMBLY_ACC=CAM_ASM_000192 /TAXON_ID=195065 /ORGANISM="Chroomonas mesostigmatica_cf, Strain CCMP1168" /LENGTH=60 /DNA_ID=CAMNT_0053692329 /DNA_START=43 /DNA_END=225 /DNA_ORIENTATION=+
MPRLLAIPAIPPSSPLRAGGARRESREELVTTIAISATPITAPMVYPIGLDGFVIMPSEQ